MESSEAKGQPTASTGRCNGLTSNVWAPGIFTLAHLVFVLVLRNQCRAQAQSPFLGSVPTGQATGNALELSLKDAIARALKYNLGAIECRSRDPAGPRRPLAQFECPAARISRPASAARIEQINLKSLGFNLHIPRRQHSHHRRAIRRC